MSIPISQFTPTSPLVTLNLFFIPGVHTHFFPHKGYCFLTHRHLQCAGHGVLCFPGMPSCLRMREACHIAAVIPQWEIYLGASEIFMQ